MNKTIIYLPLFALLLVNSLFSQILLPGVEAPPDPAVTFLVEPETLRPGETGIIRVLYTWPDGYHQTKDEQNFRIEAEGPQGILFGTTVYPDTGVEEKGLLNYYGETELLLEFFVSDTLPEGDYPVRITARFQVCDDRGVCYFPGSIDSEQTIRTEGRPVRTAESGLLWKFLLMALVGGFLLNLMPCVLPLLSVKALNLVKQSGEDRRVILFNALSYGGGIMASFIVLASVIIGLQQSGQLLGWGFQFQNPWFLIVLISVIFLFSLSLFEVFILNPPSSGLNRATGLSGRKGYLGSFFTGVFAVFVATPCTAPFLGAAMGFAFSQPPLTVLLIMIFTGLGLALPFLILGFFPSFFRHLPKPGRWMDRFREVMAFLLMGTAVYLSATLIRQIGTGFISVLWFLLVLAAAAWVWGWNARTVRRKSVRRGILLGSFIMIALAAVLLPGRYALSDDTPGTAAGSALEENWEPFDPEKIEEYRGNDEPVFLAFSASWCTTCKINEKTVLYTEEASELFRTAGLRLMKGDLTVTNEEAMKMIYSFGRAGVPLYVLYLPGKEPVLLPELLSLSILEEALRPLSQE